MSQSQSNLPSQDPAPRQDGSARGSEALFTPVSSPARKESYAVWGAAGLIVLAVVIGLILAGRHHRPGPANTALPLDGYAANLPITGAAMSESTSLSGGKSTFIDGHIRNTGTKTVTAATVQVFFRNEENMPPQIETLPLSLIRTRQPYIDTEPISADPIEPGEDREFRLIFETIPGNWNIQLPEIHIVSVKTR